MSCRFYCSYILCLAYLISACNGLKPILRWWLLKGAMELRQKPNMCWYLLHREDERFAADSKTQGSCTTSAHTHDHHGTCCSKNDQTASEPDPRLLPLLSALNTPAKTLILETLGSVQIMYVLYIMPSFQDLCCRALSWSLVSTPLS